MFIVFLAIGVLAGLLAAAATLLTGGSLLAALAAYALGGSGTAALSAGALALRRPRWKGQVASGAMTMHPTSRHSAS